MGLRFYLIFLYSQSIEALHNRRLSHTPKGTSVIRKTTIAKLKQLSLQTNCTHYYTNSRVTFIGLFLFLLQPLVRFLKSESCLLRCCQVKHGVATKVNKLWCADTRVFITRSQRRYSSTMLRLKRRQDRNWEHCLCFWSDIQHTVRWYHLTETRALSSTASLCFEILLTVQPWGL